MLAALNIERQRDADFFARTDWSLFDRFQQITAEIDAVGLIDIADVGDAVSVVPPRFVEWRCRRRVRVSPWELTAMNRVLV